MKRRKTLGLAAVLAVAALTAAACSSSPSSSSAGASPTGNVRYNDGITGVVSPSNHKGGTIVFDNTSVPDSTDPGNTYYGYMWNFSRLYAQTLMTYKSCPGTCGEQLVPDLATGPGIVGDHGLTWTYRIHPNVKFSDGQTVTAQDVKYAVERTFDRSVLPNGPSYFQVLLAPQNATCAKAEAAGKSTDCYPGPYVDRSKNLMGLNAVTTPNATTVVFHLAQPFADFNYVVGIPQTAPVPPAKDTGSNYQLNVISTGPYMFQSYTLNKQLTLVPNAYWDAAQDPNAKQLARKIVVNFDVNANDIDNRLMAGDIDVNMQGTGVQAAARAKILASPALKKYADDGLSGYLWFFYINTKVPPFNNVACRRAVEYAANKTNLQTAYGGPVAGGDIASTVLTPAIIGYKKFDLYDALSKPGGDIPAAKAQLRACGHASGFSTTIAYRTDRPTEVAAAQALEASLAQAGIKTTLKGYLSGTYYSDFAGVPNYVHSHDLGIDVGSWAPDWPDGYGMLDELANGNAIVPAGNTNIGELNDPVVNKLFAKAAGLSNAAQRNALWTQIDHQIMSDAVILPEVYAKTLEYRNPALTNVYLQLAYGEYNAAVLGLK